MCGQPAATTAEAGWFRPHAQTHVGYAWGFWHALRCVASDAMLSLHVQAVPQHSLGGHTDQEDEKSRKGSMLLNRHTPAESHG